MVKKQQKTATRKKGREAERPAGGASDNPFAQRVRESAQQIWSAGLAAFAKAQGEGGKVLDDLATETAKLQRQARAAEAGLQSAAHRMSDLAGEVGVRTGQQWDKLESIFEDRVARAMARLGMPTSDDIARLSDRVDALAAAVAALRGQVSPAAAPVKRAKAAAASTARRTAKPAAKPKASAQGAPAEKPARATTAAKIPKTAKSSNAVKAAKAGKAPQAVRTAKAAKVSPASKRTAARATAASPGPRARKAVA
ncbi:MAG: phasin family protein [Mitsuaria chitosanitabida]|uniref:phasin family protein n=1 Tax=Roseateles chitosanitabidus TaxID=65048 RepID=UPI001B0B09BC|nr:phasin family protein [Roseateles chitosanitabidus]MBO9689579.1 phasin family protein [Roseateles chitosanitabidus]